MKITLIDVQDKDFFYYNQETKRLQEIKKAIQYLQNKNNSMDAGRKYRQQFSMDVLTLASYIKKQGISTTYICLPHDIMLLENSLKKSDYVFFWSTTPNYPYVAELIRTVKRKYHCTTVIGGYHALGLPQQILSEIPELDYLIMGESEKPLLALMNGDYIKSIDNLAYREKDSIYVNNRSTLFMEFCEPDYSLLNGNKLDYRFALQTTRSCPFRCRYCIYGYYGGELKTRSLESLEKELITLRDICGTRFDMHILDNIAGYDIERTNALSNIIHNLGMEISFSGDIRAEYLLDVERIKALEALGIKQIFLGFEDADSNCRKTANRALNEKTLQCALHLLKDNSSIRAQCYWMMGLPGTTKSSFEKNIELAVNLLEQDLIEGICTDTIFVPYPGTPLFDCSDEYGIRIVEKDWRLFQRSNYYPVYELDTISREDILNGLVQFDKAIIHVQLNKLGYSEKDVLEIYRRWLSDLQNMRRLQ